MHRKGFRFLACIGLFVPWTNSVFAQHLLLQIPDSPPRQ